MNNGTRINRRAMQLRLYTGIPWTGCLQRVRAASSRTRLISELSSTEQTLLEGLVMSTLAWRKISTLHPWGITHVDPQPDRLVICMEGDVVQQWNPSRTEAKDLVEALLPRSYDRALESGIAGVRAQVEKDKVVLRSLQSPAQVVLDGIEPLRWTQAVKEVEAESADCGLTSWSRAAPDSWYATERSQMTRAWTSAWLYSGVPRRVGLVRTLGIPLLVTGWENPASTAGSRLVLDPHHPALGAPRSAANAQGHRRFARLLADPEWGLPLSVLDEDCHCRPDGSSDQCTTILCSSLGWPGELEVRTIQRHGERLERMKGWGTSGEWKARRKLALRVPSWADRELDRKTGEPRAGRRVSGGAESG
ncbi:hypothetical protein GCM10010329_80470 [Streptomyces spiroverticillatus]|uniref:Uncharacterized protein n=1 Tax=Streptomyces finlayi TaxID=67296 RepID=A0A918X7C9_9ACTN|nr:hypothetical protein [Streptomyces finlayi]GHA45846.1 hypothetical protein GCM10010329_80470 [Streptomyces spiroverticillatus]GHD15895.1 hypothetical protein GCM10010334_76390 [Streptomyces finlayi]